MNDSDLNYLGHKLKITNKFSTWIDFKCENCKYFVSYNIDNKKYYDITFNILEYNCNEIIIKNLLE